MSNINMYLLAALGISEALALIPGIKANSIFELIFNLLHSLVKKDQ